MPNQMSPSNETMTQRVKFRVAWAYHHFKNTFIPRAANNYRPHALHHRALGAYAVLILMVKILTVGWVTFSTAPANVSDVTPTNIINLSNQARKDNGIGTLAGNSLLNRAAQAKADDMLREQYFAHISPSNISPWYWFNQAGYAYQYAGENLAIDYLESEDVIAAWLASPSHRSNLLSTKYRDTGVSVVTGNFQGAQSILVVQMFGAPKPAPTTTVATTPAQTPPPTQVKQELALTPVPAPTPAPTPTPTSIPAPAPEPPAIPTIGTPDPASIVRTGTPSVIGQAEPSSRVELVVDDQVVTTAPAGADGVYTLTPTQALADGEHRFQVRAVARGLTSSPTGLRTMMIDTHPPTVDENGTFALFSILGQDTFDVFVATSQDTTVVSCACGGQVIPLQRAGDQYLGQIRVGQRPSSSTVLSLTVSDQAGNTSELGMVDTELFTTGVAAARSGPVVSSLNVLALSRTFLTLFLAVMLVLAMVNVVVVWERQHHATIVGSLLVIYLAGSLLLL